MLRVSIPAEYSYCLLDCSGIGKHSQGANINISLNLMNLLRNVTALTFNIHQIIENYMTPISHFDVHGTWAVCIWLTSSFVTGLPLCKVILSLPSLPCWLQHISFLSMNMFLCHFYSLSRSCFSLDWLCSCACCPFQLTRTQTQQSPIAMTSSSHLDGVFPSFVFAGLIHSMGMTQLVPFPYCQH